MVKTSKTSIAAIIFVIIYFLFIVFISLFKGITLYNLNFNKFLINKLFIKLDKKIILKIDDLKIYTTQKYNKDAIKIHNFFYYATKTLPLFKIIEINGIYTDNNLLIKKVILNKNNFELISPDIFISGYFKIFKKYSSTYFTVIKYKKYLLKNTSVFSYYTKKYVFANIKTHFNKDIIYIALKADDNFINYSLNAKKFKTRFNNYSLYTNNLKALGKINTKFTYYDIKFNSNLFHLKNKDLDILSYNPNGNIKNNIINIMTQKADIKYKDINKLEFKNLIFTYNLKNKTLMSDTKKAYIIYKKNKLNAKNLTFNYHLNNGNLFLHALNLKLNNDINATSQEIVVSKLPKLYFYLKDNNVIHKYFHLQNNLINGNKKIIILSDILGKVIGFNTKISNPKIDISKKIATSNNIIFNKIKFNKTAFNFNKKPFILSSSTNTLFNKNITSILSKFHTNIPITQLKGKNSLVFKVYINNKLQNITYNLNSANSFFKYNKTLNFSYKNLIANGDLNYTSIKLNHFNLPNKFLNTQFDSNISVYLNKKYINSFTHFYFLNIDHYLNIKNFNEKIVVDLKKKFLYLLNSAIFVNLHNKTIYLYSLKRLLKYSIFNKIFTDGNIIIKLLKDKTDIIAKSYIKYPLFLNQKNPYNINAVFEIKNDNVYIYNKFINVKIVNLRKINAHINSLDINIQGLIDIINAINEITKTLSKKPKQNNSGLKITINAKNTNFIYKNHKFLTQYANFYFDKEIKFNATYKKSSLQGYTKNKYLLIEGKNYTQKELVPLFDFFNHFNYINLDFITVRSPQNFYTGKIYIKKGAIKDLGALNNIIAFINTIPALLTLNNPGFSAKGYKIKSGFINYLFYNNILYFKQIKINGTNLSFNGKGYVDLNRKYIKMKIHTIIKIKLKKIPIIGKSLSYLFFGKDGYLHINIFVKGNIDNPKIEKDMGGGIIESPLKLFKRILTLPFNIF